MRALILMLLLMASPFLAQQIGVPAGSGYTTGDCQRVDANGQSYWGQCAATVVNQTQTLYNVSTYAGSDTGSKIAACLAANTAGICDARGISGAQTSSVSITIVANKGVWIGPGTTLTLASGDQLNMTGGSLFGTDKSTSIIVGTVSGGAVVNATGPVVINNLTIRQLDATDAGSSALTTTDLASVSHMLLQGGYDTQIVASYYSNFDDIGYANWGTASTVGLELGGASSFANANTFTNTHFAGETTYCVDAESANGVAFNGFTCETATTMTSAINIGSQPTPSGATKIAVNGGYIQVGTGYCTSLENSSGHDLIAFSNMAFFTCNGNNGAPVVALGEFPILTGQKGIALTETGNGVLTINGSTPSVYLKDPAITNGVQLSLTGDSTATLRTQNNVAAALILGSMNGISFSTGSAAPTGSCTSPAVYWTTAGAMYNCQSGSWVAK